MICYLYPEPKYFFFSNDVPELLYYSHIPIALISVFIGLFVLFSNRHSLLNQTFFTLTLCLFLWVAVSLVAWTNTSGELIAFLWPFFGILAGLIAILSIYFIYVYLNKSDPPFYYKIIFLLLLIPLFLVAPTSLSVNGFNITYCDAFEFEGFIYKFYYTFLGVLSIFWILILLLKNYFTASDYLKKQIIYIGIGIESFLVLFFTIVSLVTYMVNIGILEDSRLEMYGLFGILIFLVSVAFVIVEYKAFGTKLAAPVALVVALLMLVFSLLFLQNIEIIQTIVSITLFFLIIFGYQLIKSVKKEIQHREEIEELAKKLKKVNGRLKLLDKEKSEFVSIASHQLRSPLTAIGGYVSLLNDGSFGKLPEKAKEPLSRIQISVQNMSLLVEEYLNVSRIESGNMKYNLTDFNLSEQAEHICDDLRGVALKKGLLLFFRTDLESYPIVNADRDKIVQSIHNLINNSIKYTQKGTITIFIHDDKEKKKVYLEVIDTGIGMSEDTKSILFSKFKRAENANKVNIQGTGLGLYMALKITEAMGGTITAHSDGEGKGSRFVMELPLAI